MDMESFTPFCFKGVNFRAQGAGAKILAKISYDV